MIKPTCDRKTRFHKNQYNTFGLYPGIESPGTCPCATIGAGGCCTIKPGRKLPTCYVFRTMSAYKSVANVLLHNTNELRSATVSQQVKLLCDEFSRFQASELKRGADASLYYRLHWSGDVYDIYYAKALIEAMHEFPNITFWNYTRDFSLGQYLARETTNLTQYLSLDCINLESGLQAYYRWLETPNAGTLRLCYMAAENDMEKQYNALKKRNPDWPDDAPRLSACPVDEGKMPLDGACAKCRKCINGDNIWFMT